MDLLIYTEEEECFGYLSLEGSGNWEGTDLFSNLRSRILLEIQGNEDMIGVYFRENIVEAVNPNQVLGKYQKGDLLFSLTKEDGEIKTIWQELLLYEREADLKRGFTQRDGITPMMLVNEKDRGQFLKARSISEQEQPFYQYHNEEGKLQLDLYYDMTNQAGTGIFYNHLQQQITMCGFDIEKWSIRIGKENEPYTKAVDEDYSELKEYEEKHIYNDMGKSIYFCSYALRTEWKEPFKGKVVEIESIYQEDGTLKKKMKCFYGSNGFPYHSGTYYYDKQERLEYVNSYITHGYIEDYFIYDMDSMKLKYCLILDHMGEQTWELNFIKYY